MTSLARLTGWADPLTSLLDGFKGQTSPLDANHHQAVRAFQSVTNTLMGPSSGPAAFKGDAADTMRSAIQAVLQAEQGFENANVLGQADTYCSTCSQQIGQALNTAAPAMTDEPTVDELLTYVLVFDVAREGSAAVPYSIQMSTRQAVASATNPAAMAQAEAAQRTVNAFSHMAHEIEFDVLNWKIGIESLANDFSWQQFLQILWNGIASGQGLLPALLKDAEKENWKNFGEKLEKLSPAFGTLGFLIDFATGKEHDPATFWGDLLAAIVGLADGVTEVSAISGLIAISAAGVGWLQGQYAQQFPGPLGKALQQPSDGLTTGAGRINVGGILDDLGKYTSITVGGYWSYKLSHNWGGGTPPTNPDAQKALLQAGRDTVQTVEGFGQVAVNGVATILDDAIVNPIIPVPQAPQQSQAVQLKMIQGVNSVAGWITDKLNWSF